MEYITTANVLVWLFITLGFFLMFVSYWLASAALFPAHVERCQRHFSRPIVTSLIGLLIAVPPILIGFAMLKALPGPLKIISIFLIAAPILSGLIGSAGLARRIGTGLATPHDATQPWRAVLRGGAVLALTFLLPILGQLLLIPLVLAAGVGASLFAWIGSWKSQATTSPENLAPLNSAPPLP